MPSPDTISGQARAVSIATGQCFNVHLARGAAVHVSQGTVTVLAAPGWLGEQVWRVPQHLHGGGVCVVEAAGWHHLVAQSPAELRIMAPAVRPGLWSLIKSRLGRSGLLLGESRPPDIQAAE